ncbi:MAG: hypothetical protein K0S65_895 [Labilithrix sp.]|nr:hypothetical protein [Labilithrix sp.]
MGMYRGRRLLAGLGMLSLVSGCSASAEEATGTSDAISEKDCKRSPSCVVAEASLTGTIDQKLGTEIDSGWLDKGLVKVRTHFSIHPPKGEPLVAIEMSKGALLEASWAPAEKGTLTIRPRTEKGAAGEMKVHYTLVPALQAEIYGTQVNYDSTQLLEKLGDAARSGRGELEGRSPSNENGASFNYDAKASAALAPWGFEGVQVTIAAPRLEQSTIFALPFMDLGVDPATAEGKLAIQAIARPTFTYTTKAIQLDGESVQREDGVTKLAIGDADSVDVIARIDGQVELSGELDMRPVVKVDSVAEIPTFGLTTFSFSAVSKSFGGVSPVRFDGTAVHIPLPNVKVPTTPFSVGTAESGQRVAKKVTIQNTGELAAVMQITSLDPQFSVPKGEVRIAAKSTYELEVGFAPEGTGPSSTTIVVTSNDPDSPEQSIKVSANGPSALVEDAPAEEETPVASTSGDEGDAPAKTSTGCSMAATGRDSSGRVAFSAIGLALGLTFIGRRRRRLSP